MSQNHSRAEKAERYLRKPGRSGSFGPNRGFSGGGEGGGRGVSAPSPAFPSHAAPRPSWASSEFSTNRSFNNSVSGQGGQVRVNPSNSNSDTAQRPAPNGACKTVISHGPSDGLSSKSSQPDSLDDKKICRAVPKDPAAQFAAISPGAESAQFLQFGTINPGIVKGMQVPARTCSAPLNLDDCTRYGEAGFINDLLGLSEEAMINDLPTSLPIWDGPVPNTSKAQKRERPRVSFTQGDHPFAEFLNQPGSLAECVDGEVFVKPFPSLLGHRDDDAGLQASSIITGELDAEVLGNLKDEVLIHRATNHGAGNLLYLGELARRNYQLCVENDDLRHRNADLWERLKYVHTKLDLGQVDAEKDQWIAEQERHKRKKAEKEVSRLKKELIALKSTLVSSVDQRASDLAELGTDMAEQFADGVFKTVARLEVDGYLKGEVDPYTLLGQLALED